MESPTQVLLLIGVLIVSFLILNFIKLKQHNSFSSSHKIPPGPHPYPIIGNILDIGSNPLLSITNLSKIYGPIMSLKLSTNTSIVIISSPKIAKEAFHNHDLDFTGRNFPDSARGIEHHKFSIAWIPMMSPKWKALRRALNTSMFSNLKLDSTQCLRQSKVGDLINHVHQCSIKGEVIDLAQAVFTTVLNNITNMLFSKDFVNYGSVKGQKYKNLVIGILHEAGRPNVSDLLPILSFLDLQGARSTMNGYCKTLYEIFEGILEERLSLRGSKDFNDVLDSFIHIIQDDSPQLSRDDILHLLLDLFVAGIDTTSITVEWAMAELIRNPNQMEKAKTELQQAFGKTSAKLEESIVSKLPFLPAVIKETLRLYPPSPFITPHKAICDVELCGFLVPKNTELIVNIWAIGRDPTLWEDPNLFLPERFLDSEVEFKGSDFELIPFGAGRRICPGLPLASKILGLMLASLIYHFDWKVPNGLKLEDMDMSPTKGITLHKAQPLRVIAVKVL